MLKKESLQGNLSTNKSSCPEVFCKKDVKKFAEFTGKHLC